ncbi:MAG: DUF1343 domain-containing protein [Paraglaciecola sp.]|uniref:exo-beta-N-acetylmuramidase NamZ family protein n=1 Tax=Paraglaciecola sp. TaxID=1920173 RepID=UPI003298000B
MNQQCVASKIITLKSALLVITLWCLTQSTDVIAKAIDASQVGAAQTAAYFPQLKGKRIGVVVNQTSTIGQVHIVDFLRKHNFNVTTIFAPEHGFRGNHGAGEIVKSSVDPVTGIKIVSIYGKNKKPTDEIMSQLDVVIFDIQDVGVRFYTYISSMHYMMQAASENTVEFLVLDRPNPNIAYVDGPILEEAFRSFVGMHPIPLSHGMTVGELALMILGEGWLSIHSTRPDFNYALELTVVPVNDYERKDSYTLPIAPSPNLPNAQAIALYPSLCLFEATPVSIGRGTPFPFQVVGHDNVNIGHFQFTPIPISGVTNNPKLQGVKVTGQDLRTASIHGFDLNVFYQWFQAFKQQDTTFFERASFMDKLSGTDKLRKAMLAGQSLQTIQYSWQADLVSFKQQRAPYLLYK